MPRPGGGVPVDSMAASGAGHEDAAATMPDAAADGPAPGKLLVLVVDDEPVIVEGMSDALLSADVPHLAAGDATSALALLRRHPEIAVVVSDVHMPGLDGLGLVREAMRGRHEGRDALVAVLISAHFDWERLTDRRQEGIVGVLTKPFSVTELLVEVGSALAEATARRARGS